MVHGLLCTFLYPLHKQVLHTQKIFYYRYCAIAVNVNNIVKMIVDQTYSAVHNFSLKILMLSILIVSYNESIVIGTFISRRWY